MGDNRGVTAQRDLGVRSSSSAAVASAELDAFVVEYQRRYNAADAPGLAELYGVDARWLAAAGPVLDGRTTIAMALRYFMSDVAPLLDLSEEGRIVVGPMAVSRGTYTMHPRRAPADEGFGGAFLNVLERKDEGWRILCQQMNYRFQVLPQQWVGDRRRLESLPDSDDAAGWAGLVDADSGRWRVAAIDEAAYASIGGAAPVEGRDALLRAAGLLQKGPRRILARRLTTTGLGAGWAVDVGWFETRIGDATDRWGTASLVWRTIDGQCAAHWLVATLSPPNAAGHATS